MTLKKRVLSDALTQPKGAGASRSCNLGKKEIVKKPKAKKPNTPRKAAPTKVRAKNIK